MLACLLVTATCRLGRGTRHVADTRRSPAPTAPTPPPDPPTAQYVTATLTLPNAAFTFLAFPEKVRALPDWQSRSPDGHGRSPSLDGTQMPGLHAQHRPSCPCSCLISAPLLPCPTVPQAARYGNAFAIFPQSHWKTVGIVLMVAHQLVAFGLFMLPVRDRVWTASHGTELHCFCTQKHTT